MITTHRKLCRMAVYAIVLYRRGDGIDHPEELIKKISKLTFASTWKCNDRHLEYSSGTNVTLLLKKV
mgnify:CR=1 FL=1